MIINKVKNGISMFRRILKIKYKEKFNKANVRQIINDTIFLLIKNTHRNIKKSKIIEKSIVNERGR